MSADLTLADIRRLADLRPRFCQWEGCDGRTVRERDWLMGADADEPDNWLPIWECLTHAAMPDDRVYAGLVKFHGANETPRYRSPQGGLQ